MNHVETITLSRLADIIIVYGFFGVVGTLIGSAFGDFLLWAGGKIGKMWKNSGVK